MVWAIVRRETTRLLWEGDSLGRPWGVAREQSDVAVLKGDVRPGEQIYAEGASWAEAWGAFHARRRNPIREDDLVKLVQEQLTPDLLKPSYREGQKTNRFFGFCFVATEAFYHLGRTYLPERGYRQRQGRDALGGSHWWLVDKEGRVVDLTVEQYRVLGVKPPYECGEEGRCRGFQGRQTVPWSKEKVTQQGVELVERVLRILRKST
jgi:hypothetical protein